MSGRLFFVMSVPGAGGRELLANALSHNSDLIVAPVSKAKSGEAAHAPSNIITLDDYHNHVSRDDFCAIWDDDGWRYGLQNIAKDMLQ